MATKQEIRDYFAKFGKEGGQTRAKNMTPEERSAGARKAVEARWAKNKKIIDKSLNAINKNLEQLERSAKKRKTKGKKDRNEH